MADSFKCLVAIGWPDFTWQKVEVTAVVSNGVCGSIANIIADNVKQGLTKPYSYVVCYSVEPQ